MAKKKESIIQNEMVKPIGMPNPNPNPTRPTSKSYRRRALLVACRKYHNPDWNLQGPENDVKNMYETLRISGFPRSNIMILVNEKATHDKILTAIEKHLLDGAETGDVLFHYHSGHGTEDIDRNHDEPNGYDQAIVPYDGDWDAGTLIIDDDLYNLYSKKAPKDALIETFFDTCYSGTATKSFPQSGLVKRRPKYLPPPFQVKREILSRPASAIPSKSIIRTPGTRNIIQSRDQINVHWGCSLFTEVSYEDEFDGKVQGVGTYAWCKILNKQSGNMSREFLYEKMNDMIYSELQYPQTPTLDVGYRQELLQRYPIRRVIEDQPGEV